mmetsp:Transcript_40737/g.63734  ORF Transcript_40737/g.63734 Transcript_40737/m.63734 type:complete len:209 (+) Transcript_40737:481-1107(+)
MNKAEESSKVVVCPNLPDSFSPARAGLDQAMVSVSSWRRSSRYCGATAPAPGAGTAAPPRASRRPSGRRVSVCPYRGLGGRPPTRGCTQAKESVSKTQRSPRHAASPSQPPCTTILRPTAADAALNLGDGPVEVALMGTHTQSTRSSACTSRKQPPPPSPPLPLPPSTNMRLPTSSQACPYRGAGRLPPQRTSCQVMVSTSSTQVSLR